MESTIVERHKQYLEQFIAKAQSFDYQFLSGTLEKMKKPDFSPDVINTYHQQLLVENQQTSYIRAIRTYLEKKLELSYDESILVIIEIFRPLFEEGYSYTDFIYRFNRDKEVDLVNARAEWRAYFEYRFFYDLTEHIKYYHAK
jgi:hypothetical protein